MTLRICEHIDHPPVSFTADRCPCCALASLAAEEREDQRRTHAAEVARLRECIADRVQEFQTFS